MARAVLQIDADTTGILAALGAVRKAARDTEAEVRTSMGRGARAMGGAYRTAADQVQRDSQRAATAAEREANRTVRAFVRSEDQKRRAAAMSAAARERAEREATRIAETEARKRGLSAEAEARVRQSALESMTRQYETAEKRQTAIARRESRAREQEQRRAEARTDSYGRSIGTGLRRGLNVGGDAAMNVARQAHSQISSARHERASSMRTLAHAVLGGGGGAADVRRVQSRVQEFALQTGMNVNDVAQALAVGQQRGSVLQVAPGQSRAASLEAVLASVREANATNTDAGQYLAARGRLSGLGLTGRSLQEAMRFSLRAADLGNVEVDQIIQQGLPGASRLMATRTAMLGPGATDAQRQEAALSAFRESVAFQEATSAEGNAPRNMANTLANLQTFLRTPRRQEAILNNIRTAEDQANVNTPAGLARRDALRSLRESMFETDPTRTGGAMRMKAGATPLELASRLSAAFGGDASAATSMLAGTGHGNAQSLLSNMRGVLEFLGRGNASGQTGGARVTALMNSPGVTDAEMRARQGIIENDVQAQLNRNEETRLQALTDNTSKLVQLSNAIDNWATQNPIGSSALQSGGGLLGGVLGGALFPRIGGAIARSGVGQALQAGGPAALLAAARGGLATAVGGLGSVGTALTGAIGGAGAATIGGVVAGGTLAGGAIGYGINRAAYGSDKGQSGASYINPASADFWRGFATSVSQAIRDGMSTATVTVSPVDAAQAASSAPAATPPAR